MFHFYFLATLASVATVCERGGSRGGLDPSTMGVFNFFGLYLPLPNLSYRVYKRTETKSPSLLPTVPFLTNAYSLLVYTHTHSTQKLLLLLVQSNVVPVAFLCLAEGDSMQLQRNNIKQHHCAMHKSQHISHPSDRSPPERAAWGAAEHVKALLPKVTHQPFVKVVHQKKKHTCARRIVSSPNQGESKRFGHGCREFDRQRLQQFGVIDISEGDETNAYQTGFLI